MLLLASEVFLPLPPLEAPTLEGFGNLGDGMVGKKLSLARQKGS